MEATQNVAVNPLSEDVQAQVVKNLVEMKEVKFNFRTTQIDDPTGAKDEKGVVKKIDWKRPTFLSKLPLLTIQGVIAALSAGDKSSELVVDAVNDVVINRMRGLIGEKIEADPSVTLSDSLFDSNILNLVAIANLPKSERGAGIAKEAWAAFVTDYKAVMASAEAISLFSDKKPRAPEVLEKHGVLLAGKFNQVRSRKDVVTQMLGFLDVYVQVSPNAEEHLPCYEFLKAKGNAILQGDNFEDL